MFATIASTTARHPRRVALIAGLVFLVGVVVGAPTQNLLKAENSFQAPSSQSARAETAIKQATGLEPSPGVLALVDAPPSSPRVAQAAHTLASIPGVRQVTTPTSRISPLVSKDGDRTIVAATLAASRYPNTVAKSIEDRFSGDRDVQLGGADIANEQVNTQSSHDLGFAELVAFPLLVILAIVIFRGLAAVIPVAVGAAAVLWAFVALRIVNMFLSLSSFSLNLVIGLGLGLAIDYSLLLVWRFREELGSGADPQAALRVTLGTAGRTVLFSATTVAAAMASLLLFPQRFLVSMGVGGIAVALVAAATALLLVPALLILLAGRVGRVHVAPTGTGIWYRLAQRVMRRPAVVAIVTGAVLLAIASPALSTRWSGTDASVLPTSQSARIVSDMMATDFPAQDLNTMVIAVHAPASADAPLSDYAADLRQTPGVTSVRSPTYLGQGLWRITAGGAGDPIYAAAQATLKRVRALRAPFPALVGGAAADFADQQSAITSRLPLALGALAVLTLLVLWLMTDSILLPIQALVMNALTTATATGLLVFIFQHGRLNSLLAYTSQGGIEQTDFLVLAALVFALSTDYGVLLLTRIEEAHDRGATSREAVALGLERTGRLVSASAVLLAVAIGAFGTSKVIFLKEIGLGTAAAVLLDAFIVRTLLVPALMGLLGDANWWAPATLRRLNARLGLSEADPGPAARNRDGLPRPTLATSTSQETPS
jgi:uncharacterized membrane protein YdfJ with MMPL/SSD domain